MVIVECFLQICCLYGLVNELSSLKLGHGLEDVDNELKNSYRIEGFKFYHELATFNHLDVKNVVYQRQQKSELRDNDLECLYNGKRQTFCFNDVL